MNIPDEMIDKWCKLSKLIMLQPVDGLSFVINTIIPDVEELLKDKSTKECPYDCRYCNYQESTNSALNSQETQKGKNSVDTITSLPLKQSTVKNGIETPDTHSTNKNLMDKDYEAKR